MIIDVHTHVFRPQADFGPRLLADLKRCGVEPASWGDVSERHLEATRAAGRGDRVRDSGGGNRLEGAERPRRRARATGA